jgi:hypothetical protein
MFARVVSESSEIFRYRHPRFEMKALVLQHGIRST